MYFDVAAHSHCFKTEPNEAFFWHGQSEGCCGLDTAIGVSVKSNKIGQ